MASTEDVGEKLLMRTEVRIEATNTPDKLVYLPVDTGPVPMGMHGELAEHYQAPEGTPENPSTLDYVIGAVAACLTGTFKRALVARGVMPPLEDFDITATGDIVISDDVPVIRRINVEYVLYGTDPSHRDKIERAHTHHHKACAVSRSVEAAIDITTNLTLKDTR